MAVCCAGGYSCPPVVHGGRPSILSQWDIPDAERLSWERAGVHQNGAQSVFALAITVADLDYWVGVYERQLQLPALGRDRVEALGAFCARFRCGDTRLDLLAPAGAGPVADAVAAGNEAPWQLTIRVADVAKAEQFLSARGIDPRPGLEGTADILLPPEQTLNARLLLTGGA